MHKGFSNTFTWDVYNLVNLRKDQEAFQNLINKCKSVKIEDPVAVFAEGLKKLLQDEIMHGSHIVPSIYANLWGSFIAHSFEMVNWEEVAKEFIETNP